MKTSYAISMLGALSQGTRLDVFRLLVQAGTSGLAAGEIGMKLRLPSPTLSFHLSQLRHAGLITSRRISRSIIYAADYDSMNRLLSYLTENCCQGNPEACMPSGCAPAAATSRRRRAA